jgi:hypothetical protein
MIMKIYALSSILTLYPCLQPFPPTNISICTPGPLFWSIRYVDKALLFRYKSSRTTTLSAASDALCLRNWLTFFSRSLRQLKVALLLMRSDKLRQIHSCFSFQEHRPQDLATTQSFSLHYTFLSFVYYFKFCTLFIYQETRH